MSKLNGLHFFLIRIPLLAQRFPEDSVDQRQSRIINNTGKTVFTDLLQIIIEMNHRITGKQAKQNRRIPDNRQQFVAPHIHDNRVAVTVTQITGK